MKYRSKFFKIYTTFQALVKIEYFVVIKCFRCDLGGEYTSNKFYELFVLDGTIHQTLCIDNPEQNGFAERKQSKMALLKENIGILLKLFILSCCLLFFQVCFGEKLFLLL
jgi:hypothetical protein